MPININIADGDRIQSPKHCVLSERRRVDNVQNCDLYTKTTFFDFLSVE
jgi:hypothetical protein